VFDVRNPITDPVRISRASRIEGLEFRPGRSELAITDAARQLSVWNFETGEQILPTRMNITTATYWRSGEWLLALPEAATPLGEVPRWQIANGVVIDCDEGTEQGRISNTGLWHVEASPEQGTPNTALQKLRIGELLSGFASRKGRLRPIGKLPFEQPRLSDQLSLRSDREKNNGGRSSALDSEHLT